MSGQDRPWVFVLLVPSLVLNILFGLGYWSGERQMVQATSGKARDILFERLGLDAEQRGAYDAAVGELRGHAETLEPEMARLAEAFYRELATEPPDEARLGETLERLAATRLEYRRRVLAAALAFQGRLSAAQREEFRALVRQYDAAGVEQPLRLRQR